MGQWLCSFQSRTEGLERISILEFEYIDAIVVDEASDYIEAMVNFFVFEPRAGRVLASDCHQNISQFRGVVDG